MKKIAIMDTSILSFNMGDKIIMESARKQLLPIIKNAFVVDMPTKTPLYHWYEFSIRQKDGFRTKLDAFDYKFICGTNLIVKNMMIRKPAWNLNLIDLHYMRDYILVGVGTDNSNDLPNKYTRCFYQKALSSHYIHSVRDERTRQFLESIGIKAINTGCMTLWSLNKSHCKLIPKRKSEKVIFTLTDYATDVAADKILVEILIKNYKEVAYWIQGYNDMEYLKSICTERMLSKIKLIPPSLIEYSGFLNNNDCDYIGTRLHAGIKAMQEKKRSIIIGVDNRAEDMNHDCHFNYLRRSDIRLLEEYLNDEIETRLVINEEGIRKFMSQFE